MPGVTQIFFQGGTAIIFKSHEMFFTLFATVVCKMGIRRKIKRSRTSKSHTDYIISNGVSYILTF
jgi:hypothetical protein